MSFRPHTHTSLSCRPPRQHRGETLAPPKQPRPRMASPTVDVADEIRSGSGSSTIGAGGCIVATDRWYWLGTVPVVICTWRLGRCPLSCGGGDISLDVVSARVDLFGPRAGQCPSRVAEADSLRRSCMGRRRQL
jgi:hypothetical protein